MFVLGPCRDTLTNLQCLAFRAAGSCADAPLQMILTCPLTCDYCRTNGMFISSEYLGQRLKNFSHILIESLVHHFISESHNYVLLLSLTFLMNLMKILGSG